MKIVYTSDTYYPRPQGVATCIDASIAYLAKQGHEVHVIAPEYPEGDNRILPAGITVHRFKSYPLWFTTNKEERYVFKGNFDNIRQLLAVLQPDVIHNHQEFTIGHIAAAWAKQNKVPLVQTIHTYYPPYFKIYVPIMPLRFWEWFIKVNSKRFYSMGDMIVTPSAEMRQVAKEQYNITKEIEVVSIGIDMAKFSGSEASYTVHHEQILNKYPRLKDRKRLLFVGRISHEKNVEFLFKVMQKLTAKRNDVELLMVGAGAYVNRYKKLVKTMQIDDYVSFLGIYPNHEIKAIYTLSHIFTFASVTETQGVVTAEALVNSLPVVAIAALGTNSVLKDERGGFLVNEDVDDFLAKVELLLDNKEIYEQKKHEAAIRGKELSFDSSTGPQLEGLYGQLIQQFKLPKEDK
ncbi:MAG: glycosyltransferase [Spirochaetaceae bacterium]|nr:glycosyltransferase [Spirochaetaceae bacterium]